MNKADLQKVLDLLERHWTPATQSRLDAKREIVKILDAALDADPQSKEYLVRDLTGAEIYKLWREHSGQNIAAFVRRCFMAASGRIKK